MTSSVAVPEGTIIQMVRGFVSFDTRSLTPVVPIAPFSTIPKIAAVGRRCVRIDLGEEPVTGLEEVLDRLSTLSLVPQLYFS